MNKVPLMPVLAAALFAAACKDATTVDPRAQVRFFNATTGMTGNGGFTTNGQFAGGSALASGQWAQTCARIDAGATTFGFGAANAAGTGVSGTPLATLSDQGITDGRDLMVVATGSAASPQLFLFDNNFSGQLGANQVAVRFVNLAPGTDAGNTYVAFKGAVGLTPPIALNIAVGAPTPFLTMESGSNEFSILKLPGHLVVIEGTAGTLNLQARTFNTLAILPNSSDGFELVNLPRCS